MTVSAIGGVTQTRSSVQSDPLQASTLSQDDFLKILLTQLNYQDPEKPLDNQAFLAQMAQFTALEQTRQLTDSVDAILGMQSSNQSMSLLGRTVDVQADGATVTGVVTTLSFRDGQPFMTVETGGQSLTDISPSQVVLVRQGG